MKKKGVSKTDIGLILVSCTMLLILVSILHVYCVAAFFLAISVTAGATVENETELDLEGIDDEEIEQVALLQLSL